MNELCDMFRNFNCVRFLILFGKLLFKFIFLSKFRYISDVKLLMFFGRELLKLLLERLRNVKFM